MPLLLVRVLFWVSVIATAVVATMPQPIQVSWSFSDKLQHLLTFLLLTMLGFLAHREQRRSVALGLIGFGLLIELLQALPIVGRQADAYDWLADCLGIGAAVLILHLIGGASGSR